MKVYILIVGLVVWMFASILLVLSDNILLVRLFASIALVTSYINVYTLYTILMVYFRCDLNKGSKYKDNTIANC